MKRPLFYGCICLAAFLALWVILFDAPPFYPEVPVKEEETIEITGQIYQIETRSYYGTEKTNLYLKSLSLIDSDTGQVSKLNSDYKIVCELNSGETQLKLGRSVVMAGTWQLYEHASNPGEFDLADYYAVQGIVGKLSKAQLLEWKADYWTIRQKLFEWKCFFKERLYEALPEKEASILAKMLLGESSGLDTEIKELYQRNGIVHILSISGLHITIIGMGVYRLLRRLGCPIHGAAVAGAVFLLGYGAMTGFGISACRAIGMYLIRMLGEISGRSYDLLTATGVLLAVMLCDNPRLIYHCGFLLSFGSVCAIGCLNPVLTLPADSSPRELPGRSVTWVIRRILKRKGIDVCNSFLTSASVSIFTLPIMLYYFYEIPIYSPFLNLLVLPFMGLVMGVGIALMLCPVLPLLPEVELFVLSGYEKLCLLFEELPFHTWRVGRPQLWQIAVYYLGLVLLIWLHEKPKLCRKVCEPVTKYGATILLVCFLSVDFSPMCSVTFLDVGQGDCIVICTEDGKTYLFDGGSSSERNVGEEVILPFLQYSGISEIDGVFISHPDEDHMNGILELLEMEDMVTIHKVFLPDIAKERRTDFEEIYSVAGNTPIAYLSSGDAMQSDALDITCLHPPAGYASDTNAYSLCFLLEFPALNVLLTGDVEAAGERALTGELQDLGIDNVRILKVAHHGSKYSTSEAFLDVLQADLAVISCGEDNSYGHPHEETLKRLENAGSMIAVTKDYGAITVEMGAKVKVYGFREQ